MTKTTAASFEAFQNERLDAAKARLDALHALPEDAPAESVARTFDSIGAALGEAFGLAGLYSSVHPDEGVREAAEDANQKIAAFTTALGLDRKAFDAFARLDTSQLDDPELVRFIEHALRDFRRSGVDSDAATRAEITALQDELIKVGQAFDRNIMNGGRELVLEEGHAALVGLPEDYLAAHPEAEDGSVTLSTNEADVIPVQLYAERDDVRKAHFEKFYVRAYPENVEVLNELLAKRFELAQKLGYDSWAHWVLEDKMIRSPEAAHEFVDSISARARPVGKREYAELLEELRRTDPDAEKVEPWQSRYLMECVKRRRFAFDSQSVRPYFAYEPTRDGVLATTEALFGVQIRRNDEIEVWHESVECYDVVENGDVTARFYLDMHPREGKYKHAAMFDIEGGIPGESLPQAALVCNLPEPKNGEPALLLHEEVITLFHEFGHLLHHLFAVQPWYGFSGITCEWDFVEVPSQLFEEWAWSAGVLQRFARHYETGEPISTDLVDKVRAAEEYGKGHTVMGQMVYAKLSLDLYDQDPAGLDPAAVLRRRRSEMSFYEGVPGSHMECSFGHLHSYSASYYTYMWSLVIAKDFFGAFGSDLMDAALARRYRDVVLGPGGAQDAADLVRTFLGRDVAFDAWEAWLARA